MKWSTQQWIATKFESSARLQITLLYPELHELAFAPHPPSLASVLGLLRIVENTDYWHHVWPTTFTSLRDTVNMTSEYYKTDLEPPISKQHWNTFNSQFPSPLNLTIALKITYFMETHHYKEIISDLNNTSPIRYFWFCFLVASLKNGCSNFI